MGFSEPNDSGGDPHIDGILWEICESVDEVQSTLCVVVGVRAFFAEKAEVALEWDLGVSVVVACGWVNDGFGEWDGLWVLSPLLCVE